MKRLILDALKAKFEGVSEKILERLASNITKSVTSEDEVKTAVDGVSLQQLLDSYGDARATDAQKTAVLNYEKKHGLKDGKAVEVEVEDDAHVAKTTTGDGASDTDKMLKQLMDMNAKLVARFDAMDAAKLTQTRTEQFNKAIAQLPDNLKKLYGRTSYDKMSDEDFAQLMKEVGDEVDGFLQEGNQNGLVFGAPQTGNKKVQPTDVSKEKGDAIAAALHI